MGELTYPGNGIPDAFRSVLDELPGGVLVYRGTREKEILYASKGVIQMLECKDAHRCWSAKMRMNLSITLSAHSVILCISMM